MGILIAIDGVDASGKQTQTELLKKRLENDELKICEKVKKALPDFPKFAITYSVSENEEASKVNQDKMQKSLDDYNQMFGTSYKVEGISAYNANLNDRLARKEKRYLERSQQLDIVIVVTDFLQDLMHRVCQQFLLTGSL